MKIFIQLYMNRRKFSTKYNKIHRNQTNNIETFDEFNYIRLRNNTHVLCTRHVTIFRKYSAKITNNMKIFTHLHMNRSKISNTLQLTYIILEKCSYIQSKFIIIHNNL